MRGDRSWWFAIYQVVYNITDETNDDDEGSWRHNNHSRENHFHHKIKTKSLKPPRGRPSSCKLKGTGPVQCGPTREKKSKISVLFGILARSGWFLSQLLISELKYKSVNFQFSQISRFLRLATNLNETDGAI